MFTVLFVTVPPNCLSMLCIFPRKASASLLCMPYSSEPSQQPGCSHTKPSQSLSGREQAEQGIPPARSVQDQSLSQLQGEQQSQTPAQHPPPRNLRNILGNQNGFQRGNKPQNTFLKKLFLNVLCTLNFLTIAFLIPLSSGS